MGGAQTTLQRKWKENDYTHNIHTSVPCRWKHAVQSLRKPHPSLFPRTLNVACNAVSLLP